MDSASTSSADTRFEFDYYRFNGRGERPILVTRVNDAHFMRSRQSIDGNQIDAAKDRVEAWSRIQGIRASMREPYPSNVNGRFWLEFRFGGLTL